MGNERVLWRRHHIFGQEQEPRRENPYFPEKKRERHPRTRVMIVWALVVLIFSFIGYALFFSPFFRIEVISVEGNRFLRTVDVTTRIQKFTKKRILWLLPRNTIFLTTPSALERDLHSAFDQQHAIESLRVDRRLPAHLHISIRERTPNLVLENGGQSFLLDRAGVVTRAVDPADHIDPSFPVLLDQTSRPMTVGARVLIKEQIDALFSIQKNLSERTDIPVERFYLPPVQCTKFEAEADEPEEGREQNENQNTNSNTNASANDNRNASANKNKNASTNKNTNSAAPVVCDKPAEVLRLIDIRAKSSEDWEIYFRIDDSIDLQVTRLLRVLKEKHLDRTRLDYIDLRFGDRVIIK